MFIIWGFRNLVLTIGAGRFFCPQCSSEQHFRHRRFKRFFTLYFIPLIPLTDGEDFVECKNCKQKYRSVLLQSPTVSSTYKADHPLLYGYGIIILIFMFACLGLSLIGQQQLREESLAKANAEATLTTLTNSFGRSTLDLCRDANETSKWVSYTSPHVVVVNKATQEIMTTLHDKVPTSMKATSKDDLTHVMCIDMASKEYATDEYGDKNGKTVFTCVRYRRVWDVYIVDAKTGKTTAEKVFLGAIPPECPEKTNKNISRYGEHPTINTVMRNLSAAEEG
jgi:hypothetical protein